MHLPLLPITVLTALACAPKLADPASSTDDQALEPLQAGCYSVTLAREPSPDVALPGFVELSRDPAPQANGSGKLAVREPGVAQPQAPISWWSPLGNNAIELVLGGGYTGYTFKLKPAENKSWVGLGLYFADFGIEPAPPPLPLTLTLRTCPGPREPHER